MRNFKDDFNDEYKPILKNLGNKLINIATESSVMDIKENLNKYKVDKERLREFHEEGLHIGNYDEINKSIAESKKNLQKAIGKNALSVGRTISKVLLGGFDVIGAGEFFWSSGKYMVNSTKKDLTKDTDKLKALEDKLEKNSKEVIDNGAKFLGVWGSLAKVAIRGVYGIKHKNEGDKILNESLSRDGKMTEDEFNEYSKARGLAFKDKKYITNQLNDKLTDNIKDFVEDINSYEVSDKVIKGSFAILTAVSDIVETISVKKENEKNQKIFNDSKAYLEKKLNEKKCGEFDINISNQNENVQQLIDKWNSEGSSKVLNDSDWISKYFNFNNGNKDEDNEIESHDLSIVELDSDYEVEEESEFETEGEYEIEEESIEGELEVEDEEPEIEEESEVENEEPEIEEESEGENEEPEIEEESEVEEEEPEIEEKSEVEEEEPEIEEEPEAEDEEPEIEEEPEAEDEEIEIEEEKSEVEKERVKEKISIRNRMN